MLDHISYKVNIRDAQGSDQKQDKNDPLIQDALGVTNNSIVDTLNALVNAAVQGFEWQSSVISAIIFTPPIAPVAGHRYLINGTGTGAWLGQNNNIAIFNGTIWEFTVPTVGTFVASDAEPTLVYLFGGVSWTSKAFETSTASTGLVKVGVDIRIDPSSSFFIESVQDASGALAANSLRVTLTYNDSLGTLTADLVANSISEGYLKSLGVGTAGQFLKSNGSGGFVWGTIPDVITDISYSALKALYDASTMVAGYYRITDFTTIYEQPDFDGGGSPKVLLVTKTAANQPIIVFALSPTVLSSTAYQEAYPNDKIQYDITWSVTERGNPAKGRISERIDEFNNRTDYDHRTVLFKRYESTPASGVFSLINDNGGSFDDALPIFSGTAKNNFIGDFAKYAPVFFDATYPILSNIIFKGFVILSNFIDSFSFNNTFIGTVVFNKLGSQTLGNLFVGDFAQNIIRSGFNNNLGANFISNTIGESFTDNTFLGEATGNTYGFSCNNNFFGAYFQYNTFNVGNLQNTTFGENCSKNTINDSINNSILGDNFINNVINAPFFSADFSLATHVYQSYTCEIKTVQGGAARLFYYDASFNLINDSPAN